VTDKDTGYDAQMETVLCRSAHASLKLVTRECNSKIMAEFVGKRQSDVIADRVLEGLINPASYSDFAPDRAYEAGTS